MIDESTLRNVESAVRSNGYGYISQYEYNYLPDPFRGVYSRRKDIEDKYD